MDKVFLLLTLLLLSGCSFYEERNINSDAAAAYFKERLQRNDRRSFEVVASAIHHLKLAADRRSVSPEEGKQILFSYMFDLTNDRQFAERYSSLICQLSESCHDFGEQPQDIERALAFREAVKLQNQRFAFFIEKLDFQLQEELR